LLGREIACRAKNKSSSGLTGLGEAASDAKIRDLHLVIGAEENIVRLDVAVNYPLRVGRVQCQSKLTGDIPHPLQGKRPLAGHQIPQGPAVHVLHHDVIRIVIVTEVMNSDDIRMREGGNQPRFLFEPANKAVLSQMPLVQNLDRDDPRQPLILGPEDGRHAAIPYWIQKPVAPPEQLAVSHDIAIPTCKRAPAAPFA